MLCYCIVVVLLLYCYCVVLFIVIVLLYCNCVVIVLLLCCYCVVIVLLLCCHCTVIVLLYCVVIVLLFLPSSLRLENNTVNRLKTAWISTEQLLLHKAQLEIRKSCAGSKPIVESRYNAYLTGEFFLY